MRARPLACIALLTASTAALANGAMGYALEIFDFRYWAIYVVVTIVFEAWIIGRGLGFSWPKSLLVSLIANAITAYGCAGGAFAAALHHGPDPNPFLDTLTTLVVFGVISAIVETIVWFLFVKRTETKNPAWRVPARSFAAHLLGIPVALLILLIPARPYPGMEAVAVLWRQSNLEWQVLEVNDSRGMPGQATLKHTTTLDELQAALEQVDPDEGRILLCAPEYSRFATEDSCQHKVRVDFNQAPPDQRTWTIKIFEPNTTERGIIFDTDYRGYFFWPQRPLDQLPFLKKQK